VTLQLHPTFLATLISFSHQTIHAIIELFSRCSPFNLSCAIPSNYPLLALPNIFLKANSWAAAPLAIFNSNVEVANAHP
jgi:hypothetical protein